MPRGSGWRVRGEGGRAGLGPYLGFLAYHRHGSHVLQTLLALLCDGGVADADEDDEEEEEDETDASPLAAALALANALELETAPAAACADATASHACRAAFCALAGAPVLAEPRARRNDRHAHSVDIPSGNCLRDVRWPWSTAIQRRKNQSKTALVSPIEVDARRSTTRSA